MNQRLAFVLFAFAFIVAIVVGFGNHADLRPAPEEFRAKFQETLLKPLRKADPVTPTGAPSERHPSSAEHGNRLPAGTSAPVDGNDPLTREAFAAKYGDVFEISDYEGRVIRIDGSGIPSEKFDPGQMVAGYRSLDVAQVSSRAREVFEDVRHLLGVPDTSEVIMHSPTIGEFTSQVVFQQSENGIPLSPGGLVTILLGPDGQIVSVDSSAYPKTEVANRASLVRPEAAREILFVTQSAPVAVLRHAYETRDRGIQKVVDAQTGAVLLEKDRRIH
jgi:hypothetical protein